MRDLGLGRRRAPRLLVGGLALLAAGLLGTVGAQDTSRAAAPTEVTVTVESLETNTNIDNLSQADFFAKVTVDGETSKGPTRANDDRIEPDWPVTHTTDKTGEIPIEIEVVDEDDFLNGADDSIQTTSAILDLSDCQVSGTFNQTSVGDCGQTLADGSPSDGVELEFRVEAEPPASVAGLNVRCAHDPLWPDSGDQVTVTAEALDGSLASRNADEVQVWVDDPAAFTDPDTPAHTATGVQSTTHTTDPLDGVKEFSYGCTVIDDGEEVFTGWRTVAVGGPHPDEHGSGAAPVMAPTTKAGGLDIVFVADEDNYSGASDQNFQDDVRDLIKDGYFSADGNVNISSFLENQDAVNFWIASETGNARSSSCDHEHPSVSWADAMGVLHTNTFRDCAPGGERVFSSEPTSLGTAVHETGHRPFGLADEYPADGSTGDGGYFELETKPNVYDQEEDCKRDKPTLAGGSTSCRSFTEADVWFLGDDTWFTPEPTSDDLMLDDSPWQARPADERRMNWIFGLCRSAECGADHLDEQTGDIESNQEAPTDPREDEPPELRAAAEQTDDKVTVVELRFTGRDRVETVDTRVEYGRLPARVGNPPLLRTAVTGRPEGQSQLLDVARAWHPLWQFQSRWVCRNESHTMDDTFDPPICHGPGEILYEAERVESREIADEAVGRFVVPFSPDMRTFRVWDVAAGDDALDDDPDDALTEVDLEPALVEFCNDHPDDEQCAEYEGPSASDDTDRDDGDLVVLPGESITVDVLANDANPDGDPLSVTGFPDPPANGDADVNDDDTVTYTPDSGFTGEDSFTYRIADPAGATDVGSVTVTVQPDEPETVAACPQDAVPDAGFTDTAGNVHAFNIDCIAWHGITQGTTADTYSPAQQVRRDQMASFLARLLDEAGLSLPAAQDQGFGDVDGNPHAERINQLAELGITEGVRPDAYAPAQRVRRDQMASFLVRAYERLDQAELAAPASGFTDTAGNPHGTNIDKAAAAGFTEGVTADAYAPANPVRRDQMASFLARTLEQGANDGHVTPPSS